MDVWAGLDLSLYLYGSGGVVGMAQTPKREDQACAHCFRDSTSFEWFMAGIVLHAQKYRSGVDRNYTVVDLYTDYNDSLLEDS